MFEISRIFKSVFSSSRRKPSRSFLSMLIVIFAVMLGSAGQITSVSAGAAEPAPQGEFYTYKFGVYMPDPPYCVGQDYQVRVKVVKAYIPDNVVDKSYPEPVLAVRIESSARNESIATLSPRYSFAFDIEDDNYEFGSVYFTLNAKKAGTTDLYFETLIGGEYASSTKSIKVVNCKYRVVVTSAVSASFPNITVLAATIAKGEMKANPDGTLGGTANIVLNPYAFSQCFTHQLTAQPGTATLRGVTSADGTSLTVTVNFPPIPVTSVSNATCYTEGGSNNTTNLQHPTLEVTVPSTGGAESKPVSIQWGEMGLSGEAVINVIPVENQ